MAGELLDKQGQSLLVGTAKAVVGVGVPSTPHLTERGVLVQGSSLPMSVVATHSWRSLVDTDA